MADEIEVTELTPRAQQLLEALRARAGAWVSRGELAQDTGKRQLSQHDILLLERMTSAGIVESRRVKRAGGIPYAIEYRSV